MKGHIRNSILFLAILFALFLKIQDILGVSLNENSEMLFNGYYREQKNTVDVVMIGNSHCHRYWQSPYIWDLYGISGLNLSAADMPGSIYKNMGIEALKTQSPKVLIFDATAFANVDKVNTKIHLTTKNMKTSLNYFDTIHNYCNYNSIAGLDTLPYYIPVIQFHSRWKDLREEDFTESFPSYLNGCYLKEFLEARIDGAEHTYTKERTAIGRKEERELRDLLEWCRQQNEIKIEFISPPTFEEETKQAMMNTVGDIIKEYHIPYIDYNEPTAFEQFHFVSNMDYGDKNHTNVNGAYKFCKVYGQHLLDTYHLTDHRNEKEYASWNDRTKQYYEIISDYFIYGTKYDTTGD